MPRLIHLNGPPGILGRLEEIERFDALAREHGAAFCEITLMDDRQEALARFYRDRDDDTHGVRREIRQVVTDGGGPALLASIYDQLTSVLAARPRSPSWPAPRAPSRRTTRRWPRSSRLAEPDPARPPWNFGRAA